MNRAELKTLERMLDQLERRARRPKRRISTAAIVLALGLVLADVLLTWLVPTVWAQLLPGGLDQAALLRGWPGLVWHAAVYCHFRQSHVQIAIAALSVFCFLLSYRVHPVRYVVWVAAVGVIVLNALILFVTMQTCLRATAADAGFPLG
jgi:hypothetical protein